MVWSLIDRVLAHYPLDPFHSDALGCLAKCAFVYPSLGPCQSEEKRKKQRKHGWVLS